jgi:hypothetical protein
MMMIMIMIVVVMVVVYALAMTMRVPSAGVGPAFGIELIIDERNGPTQTAHHALENVVILQPQPAFAHLNWHMTIAKMVGDAGKRRGVASGNVDKFFRRSPDTQGLTGIGGDQIPIPQHRTTDKIKSHCFAGTRTR